MSLIIDEKWVPPSGVYEGQVVVAPYTHENRPTGLRCKVVVAAGVHARVANEKFGFDRWFPIDSLRVETPKGPRALSRLQDPSGEFRWRCMKTGCTHGAMCGEGPWIRVAEDEIKKP